MSLAVAPIGMLGHNFSFYTGYADRIFCKQSLSVTWSDVWLYPADEIFAIALDMTCHAFESDLVAG